MENIIITIPTSGIDNIIETILESYNRVKFPHEKIYLYFLLNNMYHPEHNPKGKGRYTFEMINHFRLENSGKFMEIEMDFFEFPYELTNNGDSKIIDKTIWRKEILIPIFNRCFDQYHKAKSFLFVASDYLMRDPYTLHKFDNIIHLLYNKKSIVTDLVIDITQMANHPVPIHRIRTPFYDKDFKYLRLDQVKPSRKGVDLVEMDYTSGRYFVADSSILAEKNIRFDPDICDGNWEMRFVEKLKNMGFSFYGLINTLNLHLKYPEGLWL